MGSKYFELGPTVSSLSNGDDSNHSRNGSQNICDEMNRIKLLTNNLAGHPFVESLVLNEATQALVENMSHTDFLHLFKVLRSHVPPTPRMRAIGLQTFQDVVDIVGRARKILVISVSSWNFSYFSGY